MEGNEGTSFTCTMQSKIGIPEIKAKCKFSGLDNLIDFQKLPHQNGVQPSGKKWRQAVTHSLSLKKRWVKKWYRGNIKHYNLLVLKHRSLLDIIVIIISQRLPKDTQGRENILDLHHIFTSHLLN